MSLGGRALWGGGLLSCLKQRSLERGARLCDGSSALAWVRDRAPVCCLCASHSVSLATWCLPPS